jgi:hypothetical protein
VNNNILDQVFNGILISNFNYKVQPVIAYSNTVTMNQDVVTSSYTIAPQTGINMTSINPGFIQLNTVSGPGDMTPLPPTPAGDAYGYPIMEAIHVNGLSGRLGGTGPLSEVCSNTVHDINTGFIFMGGNWADWYNNNMYNDAYGYILDGSLNPSIGTSGLASGNIWTGSWVWGSIPLWQTYTMGGGTSPTANQLYVTTLPVYNGSEIFAPYDASSLNLTTGGVPCTILPGSSVVFRTSDTTADTNKNDANPGIIPAKGNIGKISLIPNPNRGNFTIAGTLPGAGAYKEVAIEVVDMLGRTILSDVAPIENGAINKTLTLNNNIANGVYMVKIKTDAIQVIEFVLSR